MFFILLYNSVLLSASNSLVNLYNGDLQTTTVLFTCNFTQGWLNYYRLDVCFVLPFYGPTQQSVERSWSRMFRLSLSREHIVYTSCLLLHEAFDLCFCGFCQCINGKWYYTVSICVTIFCWKTCWNSYLMLPDNHFESII